MVDLLPKNIAYCSSYCDSYNYFVEGFTCDWNRTVYCCGPSFNKSCCDDYLYINDDDPVSECPYSDSSFYSEWSLIYGLLAVLMIVLMIVIGCICCRGYQIVSRRTHHHHHQNNSGNRQRRNDEEEMEPQYLEFDPTCEYAFEPPRYETLPIEPPKYNEIYPTETDTPPTDTNPTAPNELNTTLPGYENQSFAMDELSSPSSPPPPFQVESSTGEPAYNEPVYEEPVYESPEEESNLGNDQHTGNVTTQERNNTPSDVALNVDETISQSSL